MKIKVNLIRETISIKGLTATQFAVINELLNHVRLGQSYDGGASQVPFDFSEACDEVLEELEAMGLPVVSVSAVPSDENESVCVILCDPTLELHVE